MDYESIILVLIFFLKALLKNKAKAHLSNYKDFVNPLFFNCFFVSKTAVFELGTVFSLIGQTNFFIL